FIFTIFTAPPLLAQDDVNQMDAQGKRHGVWKKYYPGTQQLRYEGQFDHGKEVGTFKFYCAECGENPTTIKEFKGDGKTATVTYYTIKGKLVSKGLMEGKDRVGEWIYFHEKSEQPMSKESYVNGELHGVQTTFYPNGQKTEEITYANGVKQGDNLYYSPEGVLLKKLIYHNDKLHGPAEYYDANGNVTIKGYYKNGMKHGLWQYFKNGKVELEETYPKPIERDNK
ncbi:MAG: toxin-antitoxin system YwqK family antitoxin, partial [Marinirhabdus sp.]|nr:toxin-antitoxin system YwqK family antitoxin [Marinirhabdus sp.]